MATIIFALVAFFSTCLGGAFAFRARLHFSHLLGFTAGTIIGLAIFGWLPRLFDALSTAPLERLPAASAVMIGFLFYHVLDKACSLLQRRAPSPTVQGDPLLGSLSVLFFALHRLFEGIGIGAGFQMNTMTGVLLGCAVILHDLLEGCNATVVLLVNHSSRRQALIWLLLFAIMPLFGALLTLWITLPEQFLPRYLGFFVGLFLCIGASHILPEAHRERSSFRLLLFTIAGALLASVIATLPTLLVSLF